MASQFRSAVAILMLVSTLPATALEITDIESKSTDTSAPTSGASRMTPIERARSSVWGLSETEWHRYKLLMQGIRGSISPATISPIEVLGIHARDDDERRRYAERWVRVMREDVERILAFQRAYDAAGKRLYPNQPLIDVNRLPVPDDKPQALESSDRVLFFTRPECPACDVLLATLLRRIERVAGIDLYIAGFEPGDDQAVRAWAAEHGIEPTWVRDRRLTLNYESGVLDRITQGKGEIPYLMRQREGELSVLRPYDL